MLNHDFLTFAATAYENGRVAGRVAVYLLIAAVLYRYLLLPRLSQVVTPPVRRAIAVAGILVVALVGVATARGDNEDAAAKQARTDMLAGCVDTAGEEMRSYCGCVVDEVMERNGTSREELDRLDAEIRKAEDGGQIPAVMTESIEVCAPKAQAAG
jgi:hypothetical protein